MKTYRISSLDGLRGIFAVIVMCGHFYLLERPTGNGFRNVALAVQFFFMLSGVALCYGYESTLKSQQLGWWQFVRQRLARLYPMHLVAMLAAGLFIARVYGAIPTGGNMMLDTVANLTLLQAMGVIPGWSWNVVSWSISTEFWIGIFILPFAIRRLSGPVAAALAIVGYAAVFLSVQTFERPFYRLAPGVTLAAVTTAAGMLAGVAIYRLSIRYLGRYQRSWPALFSPALLAVIVTTICAAERGYAEIFALACMPPLIFLAAAAVDWFTAVLASRPLSWLGAISYSLYLIHIPMLGALRMLGLNDIQSIPLRFAVFSVATLCASHVLYRFFELPVYTRLRGGKRQLLVDSAKPAVEILGSSANRS